jgi:hypothetical protein
MKQMWFVAAVCLLSCSGFGAEPSALGDKALEEKLRAVSPEREDNDRLGAALDLAARHRLTSRQVKQIAERLPDDSARYEFALAAYANTIDPDNFYEVYDAFTSYSKVFRLHDRIRPGRPPVHMPGPVSTPAPAPATITDVEMQDILKTLRNQSFDNNRADMAKQILSSSRKPFLAAQIKQMVACFSFEQHKLEIAKYAYAYTFDPERYFLVGEAFSFEGSRQALSNYVKEKQR